MALRLLTLCLCTSIVLAAPSPAPSLAAAASGSCYETVKMVPEWCAQMFLKAVFNGNMKGITRQCCILLACVRESTCAVVLHDFCEPPWAGECPKAPPSLPAIAPAVTTGARN